ncbi:hypothetical protein [Methanosarcina sp.]|uniref:hypothetical protein n=1 Tax=Methanosarcina sp. TaxID=2213 RepID=UPI002632F3E5|nr:hypothetical protein [Methanosarcina sp.]
MKNICRGEIAKMLSKDAVKDFFAKGRGVLLGFSLLLLGALLITVNKIIASIVVLIGIILLTLSDYISENEEEELTWNEEDEDEDELK